MIEKNALPVLVVEDDAPTRRLLEAVLLRAGFESAFATNGGEAIRLLSNHDYAVVVLDIMMPEIGGREVVDFISESSLSVPVVICSAAGPRVLAEFSESPVKAVIRKPFDVDEFVTAVRAASTHVRV